jgi:ADP-heptose:LPS heptosyltransferase
MIVTSPPLNSKVCIISARRYGDAIINARLAKAAAQSRPDIEWVIWTKPEFAPLFKLMGFNHIITSEFPIAGGTPKFFKNLGLSLLKAISKLRKLKLNASIDFIGDTREATLGAMIAGNAHHSPQWNTSHWMHQLIWNVPVPFVQYIQIPQEQDQVYDVVATLLQKLIGCNTLQIGGSSHPFKKPPVVAFHPFPSAKFRYWPMLNWQELGRLLQEKKITPIILCSEAEKQEAEHYFNTENPIQVKACSSIAELVSEIKKVDLLIGVDSFLIHLGAALGKKTISITTGHLPHWWSPPENIPIGQSGGCSQYPCANQPSCLKTNNESQCIKSIEPGQVLKAIEKTLS